MSDILYSKIRITVPPILDGKNAIITSAGGNTRTVTMYPPFTDIMVPGMEKYNVQAGLANEDVGLGYGKIKKVEGYDVKIVSWADGTDEEIADMLDAYRDGIINIQDYWHVGDVRTINVPYISSKKYYGNPVGPIAAHSNKLKIAKFGDSKNIVSGSDKAIICTFNSPTPSFTVGNWQNDKDFTMDLRYYMEDFLAAIQTSLGDLSSYLRTFTKYCTRATSSSSTKAITRRSKSGIKCSGLSGLDILPSSQTTYTGINSTYWDPLPIFTTGAAYNGYNIMTMDMCVSDSYSDAYWVLTGTNTSGVPQLDYYGYSRSIYSGYNSGKAYLAPVVVL